MNILVTGGAGFIGSNLLNLLVPRHPEHRFVNLDSLTYAGNPTNLRSIEGLRNYELAVVDITDAAAVDGLFEKHRPTRVIHLLEAFRRHSADQEGALFHHVSTDEVYGSLGETGLFKETTAYDPSSPYSASKASSDHLVRAYHRTYGMPFKLTNCSNNYGPFQFPEKLIPLMILNALDRKPLTVYGEGTNVRDWLYVTDHCEAICTVMERGKMGETYNIGGRSEMLNIDVVKLICKLVAEETSSSADELERLITYVKDRPGHDLRYAIDSTKLESECGWRAQESFESGLRKTVRWYLNHREWTEQVRSGEYRNWIDKNYGDRGVTQDQEANG